MPAVGVSEIEARVAAAQSVGQVGDGWLTRSAQDLIRLAAFAGFDVAVLVRRVAVETVGNRGRLVNARSVERIMGEMADAAGR